MSQSKDPRKDLIDKINQANNDRYEDGIVIEEYIKEPYHQCRITIALDFLKTSLDKNFCDISRGNIRVVDIGTGSGYVAKTINDMGFSVVAADFEKYSFRQECSPSLELVSFDANGRFPFDDESVHAIFSGELIEHLFDTALFLAECKRILKPKGVLVITTPNLASLQDRCSFIFGYPPRHVNPLHPYLKLHIRQFSYRSLKKCLRAYGFEDIRVKSNYLKLYIYKGMKLYSRLLAKVFPNLGGSLIAKAIKS